MWLDVAILGVLVIGLFFAGYQLRSMRRSRDAELLAHMTMLWESEPLREGREQIQAHVENLPQVLERSAESDITKFIKLITVANYFETVGLLVKLKCLGHKPAKELFGSAVWEYYKLYDPYIKAHRGEDPELYIYFEHLMRRNLKK